MILLLVVAILIIVASFILAYGFYKLGDTYNNSTVKTGGLIRLISLILSLIPFVAIFTGIVFLISAIFLALGLGTLKDELQTQQPTPPTAYRPPPPV